MGTQYIYLSLFAVLFVASALGVAFYTQFFQPSLAFSSGSAGKGCGTNPFAESCASAFQTSACSASACSDAGSPSTVSPQGTSLDEQMSELSPSGTGESKEAPADQVIDTQDPPGRQAGMDQGPEGERKESAVPGQEPASESSQEESVPKDAAAEEPAPETPAEAAVQESENLEKPAEKQAETAPEADDIPESEAGPAGMGTKHSPEQLNSVMEILMSLEELTPGSESFEDEIKARIARIKEACDGCLNAKIIYEALSLMDANDVYRLSPYIWHMCEQVDKDYALRPVPTLFLGLMLNVVEDEVDREPRRRILGMMKASSPLQGEIVKNMTKVLGVSNQLIYTGQREFMSNGVILVIESKNHAGAGRADIHQVFRENAKKELIAFGVSEEAVEDRIRQGALVSFDTSGVISAATPIDKAPGEAEKAGEDAEKKAEAASGEKAEKKAGTSNEKKAEDGKEGTENKEDASGEKSKFNYEDTFGEGKTMGMGNLYRFENIDCTLESVKKGAEELQKKLRALFFRMDETLGLNAFEKENGPRSSKFQSETEEICFTMVGLLDFVNEKIGLLDSGDISSKNLLECEKNMLRITLAQGLLYEKEWIQTMGEVFSKFNPETTSIFCFNKNVLSSFRSLDAKGELGILKANFHNQLAYFEELAERREQGLGPFDTEIGEYELDKKCKETLALIDELHGLIESPLADKKSGHSKKIDEALRYLDTLKNDLVKIMEKEKDSEDANIRYSLCLIVESYRQQLTECRQSWNEDFPYPSARSASTMLLKKEFQGYLKHIWEEYNYYAKRAAEQAGKPGEGKAAEEAPGAEKEQDSPSDAEAVNVLSEEETKSLDEVRKEVEEKTAEMQATCDSLVECLKTGLKNKGMRQKGKKACKKDEKSEETISNAIERLESTCKDAKEKKEELADETNKAIWESLRNAVFSVNTLMERHLERCKGKKDYAAYTAARDASASIVRPKFGKTVDRAWRQLQGALVCEGWKMNSEIGEHFKDIQLDDDIVGNWLNADTGSLPIEERRKLYLGLWKAGWDPTDIRAWITYILSVECDRNFGPPTKGGKVCRMTRRELANAFRYLTGQEVSRSTLWSILTKEMGYSRHKCAKLDQAGEPSPWRDMQLTHIGGKIKALLESPDGRTLIASVDTKAFIVLGRLRHDHGVLMCSADGALFRVCDHDFAFLMSQIYPNGTKLVDSTRMNEKAILRPVGVYLPQYNEGYVLLVLGKDTAESMCDLLKAVVKGKRESDMPGLENLVILADGGGANSCNSHMWKEEVAKLTDDLDISVDISHYPVGSSKHNLIEHMLFNEISIHWSGRPFLDIEHVVRYVRETTTKTNLRVHCWFTSKYYMSRAEKIKYGYPVPTSTSIDKLLEGRITHEFADKPDTDMYKLNYKIISAKKAAEEKAKKEAEEAKKKAEAKEAAAKEAANEASKEVTEVAEESAVQESVAEVA